MASDHSAHIDSQPMVADFASQHWAPCHAIAQGNEAGLTKCKGPDEDGIYWDENHNLNRDQVGTKFRDQVLKPLIEAGLVEMTIPHKPQSSNQEYRLNEKSRKVAQRTKEKSS